MTRNDAELGLFALVNQMSQAHPLKAAEVMATLGLQEIDFTSSAAGQLWSLVKSFVESNQAVDILAIVEHAKRNETIQNAGGKEFILKRLMHGLAPSRMIAGEYGRFLIESSARERAQALMREGFGLLKTETPEKAILQIQEQLRAILNRNPNLRTAESDLVAFLEAAEQARTGARALCIPTHIRALDAHIGGLQSSVLTLIGALPGVGKSALLASMLYQLTSRNIKCGFFSLEDERLWITRRWVSSISGVNLFEITTGQLDKGSEARFEVATDKVHAALKNLIIDDRQGLTPAVIVETAKDMIVNHGCRVIFLDHLGEVKMERSDRFDLDIGDALAALRQIAKSYNVPVVVASHVKRRQGMTIEDAPHLTDFANSAAPERMARVALGLSKLENGVRVSILKQTNGPSGKEIGLKFLGNSAMIDPNQELHLPQ